jgi:hypothetical protein
MIARRAGIGMIGFAAVVAAAGLVVGGCTAAKAQPTPIVVFITASPTSLRTAAISPTQLPTVAPTPIEQATPAASTAPPAATAVPSSTCTGSVANQAFLAEVAAKMSWDVYCPVLPSGWYFTSGTYEQPYGGRLKMTFKGPGDATLEVDEGSFCVTDASTCSPNTATIGSANFGDLPGSLDSLSSSSLVIYVTPGTPVAYTLIATGLSQEQFVSTAATFAKVAKS